MRPHSMTIPTREMHCRYGVGTFTFPSCSYDGTICETKSPSRPRPPPVPARPPSGRGTVGYYGISDCAAKVTSRECLDVEL